MKFGAVFSVTQLPVAALEAVFTVAILRVVVNTGGVRIAGLEAWVER